MAFPCIEVAHAPSADAYRTSPTNTVLVQAAFDLLKETDGMVGLYHGLQVEDAKHVYAYILWDHIDSHNKFIADTARHQTLLENVRTFITTKPDIFHIQPNNDPLPALKAPITELARYSLKNPKDKDKLGETLDKMIAIAGTEFDGFYGATWGKVVEEEGAYAFLVGWESVEAHLNARNKVSEATTAVRSSIGRLVNVLEVTHSAQHPYL